MPMRRLAAALSLTAAISAPAAAATCDDAAFIDGIAEAAWVNIDLVPAQGTAGLREALRSAGLAHPNQPVRIRLAPGHYADNLGTEVYAQRLQRGSTNPIDQR